MHLQMTVVWERGGRPPAEVVVDAPPSSTVADLVGALRGLLGPDVPAGSLGTDWSLVAHGSPLTPSMRVGEGELVDGAVLTIAPVRERPAPTDPSRTDRRPGGLTLAVVSGPDAGRELPLRPGTLRLGRGTSADLPLADPDLSRSHAAITVTDDGVRVRDAGSTNGTRVADRPVADNGTPLQAGDTVRVGSSRLQVRSSGRRPAAAQPARDGVRLVNRSPRIAQPVQPRTFTLPPQPQRPQRGRLPWVAMLAPIPVGVVLALVFSPVLAVFTLMTPLLMGATALSDRVNGKRSYAAQLAEHDAAVCRVRACAATALAEERRVRQVSCPDPAEVLAIAARLSTRLWERRRTDPDVLDLRLGTWSARSQVRVADATPHVDPEVLESPDYPCTVAVATTGVLGVAAPTRTAEAVGRGLVGQVAALHSPRDVQLWVLVARRADGPAWEWVTRLPHNRTSEGRRFGCLEADAEATANVVQTLLTEVERRRRGAGAGAGVAAGSGSGAGAGATRPWRGPRSVLVLVGAGELREIPGVAALLADGPSVGLGVIAIDDDPGRLPNESRAVVEAVVEGPRTSWRLTAADDVGGHSLVVDQVGSWWADRLSRALAPLRDSTPDEESALPDAVSLLDLLPCDARDATSVAQRWTVRPASTEVPIGVTTGGPCTIDLRRDGPHVLVGGTTGSGKSELLRTLVTGLAAVNRPDRLAFVLVDYKGGAAFRECARLPHTVGMVTDLDAHLATRALTSLTAELKRREALFASVGARDLEEWDQRRGRGTPPVPRLVIVIDEFRVLAEEYPDFLAGLVRIAAVGRSLGVHLVLATQRPAGVVSADIKANVHLRIALRVRDRADSDDVIDDPAAAGISERTPGRALARTGSEPPVSFQAATVAGAARPLPLTVAAAAWTERPVPSGAAPAPRADEQPQAPAMSASPRSASPEPDSAQSAGDLADVVASLRAATAMVSAEPVPSPWLAPLPEHLPAEEVRHAADPSSPVVALGLVDLPSQQEQRPLVWDFTRPGHWAAIGTSGSGRTGFLRLLATEAARLLGPHRLHLYAVDGGRGGLRDLSSLPHTGAVVPRDDRGRLERLVRRLEREVARRRADAVAAHPLMLLLVDDWDLVAHDLDAVDHGLLTERIVALLRDGSGVGLRTAVTGERALMHGRLASLFTERLVLRLADPTEAVLLGLARSAMPVEQPPGRAVLCPDGTEVQLAAPSVGPIHGLEAVAASGPAGVPAMWHDGLGSEPRPGSRPLRVEPLPERVPRTDVIHSHTQGHDPGHDPDHTAGHTVEQTASTPSRRPAVPVGVGGDELDVVGLDPHRDGPLWLVAGSSRSGKSTALCTLGEGLAHLGHPLAVVSTRRGPLDRLRDHPAVSVWAGVDDTDALVAARRTNPDLAVLVDDADQLLDTPVEPVLRELARAARQGHGLVVCSASTGTLLTQYRGVAVEVARSQVGLLLGARGTNDGELFGLAAGRGHASADRDRVPGRGLLVTAAGPVDVQVAVADAEVRRREDSRFAQPV
ncbi:DNA segregation ATPase FtsK/SpoIIIE, S-DNA-T family [Pedococcus cremeus]|uniref:DNA segregation ATPase FtsK/SpoIIIE, S-DNA-T family n=1 Tax=Pedococcus cremeus TaxID=587636 RepID=A0A1H9UD05_9MICO|nr:FtsK/SpoIIIE domain-containing protein [Pedococcus cremeus]SES07222.1 DNA segregation ATPase FtsK/SpoIIIE, S-DNA-T family [Pedococcus cremeus]